jgi:hypothetical protein
VVLCRNPGFAAAACAAGGDAVDVTADASKACRDVLKQLLASHWDTQAFHCLQSSLRPRKSALAAASPGAGAAKPSSNSSSVIAVRTGGPATTGTAPLHLVSPGGTTDSSALGTCILQV